MKKRATFFSFMCFICTSRHIWKLLAFDVFTNFVTPPPSPSWGYLLFFLGKYFHDDTAAYSWCPGEELRKCLAAIIQTELRPDVSALSMLVLKRFLEHHLPGLLALIIWTTDFCSTVWWKWKKGNASPPPPPLFSKRVKKKRGEKPTFHLVAFRCTSKFAKLSHFKAMMFFLWHERDLAL